MQMFFEIPLVALFFPFQFPAAAFFPPLTEWASSGVFLCEKTGKALLAPAFYTWDKPILKYRNHFAFFSTLLYANCCKKSRILPGTFVIAKTGAVSKQEECGSLHLSL